MSEPFHGYIRTGRFGWTRVLLTGHGMGHYYMPVRFSAWSRDKAMAKAERWCRRQLRAATDEPVEVSVDE